MCCTRCETNRNNFGHMTKNHFNQFQATMNYLDQTKSMLNAKKHAKQKLTLYLANSLGVCPNLLTNRVMDTVRNSSST